MKHEIYCGFTTYHSPYHPLCLCQQFVFFGLKDLVPEQLPSGNWIHQGVETMHQRRSVGRRVAAGLRNGWMLGRKCLVTAKGVQKPRNGVLLFFSFSLCRAVCIASIGIALLLSCYLEGGDTFSH